MASKTNLQNKISLSYPLIHSKDETIGLHQDLNAKNVKKQKGTGAASDKQIK